MVRVATVLALAMALAACGAATGLDPDTTVSRTSDAAAADASTPDAATPVAFAIPLTTYRDCDSTSFIMLPSSTQGYEGTGVVTLGRRNGVVTATIGRHLNGASSLAFTPLSPTTAGAASGQSFTLARPGVGEAPATFPVTTATLALVDTTLFLTIFDSTSGSAQFVSCPATAISVSAPVDAAALIPPGSYGNCAALPGDASPALTGVGGTSFVVAQAGDLVTIPSLPAWTYRGTMSFAVDTSNSATLIPSSGGTVGPIVCQEGQGDGERQAFAETGGALIVAGDGLVMNVVGSATCGGFFSVACQRIPPMK